MKIGINKDVRIKRDENFKSLRKIEENIRHRIYEEYMTETKAIWEENEKFLTEDKAFRKQAEKLLSKLPFRASLKVTTQIGENNSILETYKGYLERPYLPLSGYLDFVCQEKLNGKPFTISFSCLQSIEVSEE